MRRIAKAAKNGRPVAILTHRGPDADAFGTSEGLAETAAALGAFVAGIFHAGNATPLAATLQCKVRPIAELAGVENAVVLLGDASDHTDVHVRGELPEGMVPEPDFVLDHHEGPVHGRAVVRHREGGSASVLSAVLLAEVACEPLESVLERNPGLATKWALGAATDANLFGDGTPVVPGATPHPVAKAFLEFLAPFVDKDVLEGIRRQEEDPAYRLILDAAKQGLSPTALQPKGCLLSSMILPPVPDITMIGRAADEVRSGIGGDVVIVGGVIQEPKGPHLAISVRTGGTEFDASDLVRVAFGNGGGKKEASGCRIPVDEDFPVMHAATLFHQGVKRLAA